MSQLPKWQYDEMKYSGADYGNEEKVNEYNPKMKKLRDIEKENTDIIYALKLSKEKQILDIGAGTGNFILVAAEHCDKVFAVDVSPTMLDFSRDKAKKKQLNNIEFIQGGFLTYNHNGKALDAIVSQFALHHLPDFWKLVALKRLHSMLNDKGKFYLKDIAYSFDTDDYSNFFDNLLDNIRKFGGINFAKDIELSISSEYVTLADILESLLDKAEFKIEKADYYGGFLATYVCSKK